MNVFFWIVQGLLAAVFLFTGASKITQPHERLREQQDWVSDFSGGTVRVIGALEVLGALGLIVPPLVGVLPIVAPLAAIGLALLMVGAMVVHARRREPQMIVVNVVLLVLAAIAIWGRLGPESL